MTRIAEKAVLRKAMLAVLVNLDPRWVKAASTRVCENLSRYVNALHTDGVMAVEHVLAWSSFFPGEIDLNLFIEGQLAAGRRVYLPQTRADRSMQFIAINEAWADNAVAGLGGVPEPSADSGRIFDPHFAASTAIIVPGLAFDKNGCRLGRGRGFYDMFLARSLMHSARVVGVSWELQIVPEVPVASHDHKIEALVTEAGVHLGSASS